MKKLSIISILTAAALALATASFSGDVPNNGGGSSQANNAAAIARLQSAAKSSLDETRKSGKTNADYMRKTHELDLLIDRLQSGQQIDPADIDKAR